MIIIIILMEHFNLLQVALSLVATCMVLKCYYNNPSVTEMPAWIKTIVLDWLAKIVQVKVPPGLIHVMEKHVKEQEEVRKEIEYERRNSVLSQSMGHRDDRRFSSSGRNSYTAFPGTERRCSVESRVASTLGLPQLFGSLGSMRRKRSINEGQPITHMHSSNFPTSLEGSMKEMLLKQDSLLKNVRRLVHVIRETEENDIKKEEWKIVASIIDACFFWLFMAALIISSLVIFLQAPNY